MPSRARAEPAIRSPGSVQSLGYRALFAVAASTSAGIWLLMILDEDRSVGAATVEMFVKFTNLTVMVVAAVAARIATGRSCGPTARVAHLTAMAMAVITAIVNATLLDASLPGGWWGVVDLVQHYLIPVAVVALWATAGPPVAGARSRAGLVTAVPVAWFVLVAVRGSITDSYPYDFIDVATHGWARVVVTVAAILGLMIALGAGLEAIDRRRLARTEARAAQLRPGPTDRE